ncbi:hypothetical protein HDV03_000271 [Kappamyces sp. JEL0829]|nr:hypothetical protein HDV03_000271 [Kappamyces sp. JEL0829]
MSAVAQPIVPQNPRGIPQAPFVENVSTFLAGSSHESTLSKFQEMISKYRFMENHLLGRRGGLEGKIPEIKKSLDLVVLLDEAEGETTTDFELSDTLWVKAKVPKTKVVNLWLGANVMLEYPIPEAKALLESKLKSAVASLVQVKEDLEYLKVQPVANRQEQITTMEVNMARVYNDDVKARRSQKA